MAKFYNPYHFVPVEAPGKSAEPYTATRKQFQDALVPGNPPVDKLRHVTHDRYVPEKHAGRLLVRLTTVTPTVIGAQRDKESDFPPVQPYRIGGRPAIPASTLRGLVGSVIEAASNGPLRILHDRPYSFRRQMTESLSAIGLIVEEEGKLRLQPMCLPTLESKDGGRTFLAEAKFKSIFPTPQFKVYFGDYASIRSPEFQYITQTDPTTAVPMPVKQLGWRGSTVVFDRSLHVKANRYAVAQDADSYEAPRLGMVRVLGCRGKERESIPKNKTHELWIPLPNPKARLLEISEEARQQFEQLADERTDAEPFLPFAPEGSRPDPNDRGKGKYLRLRAGDMVFFDVNTKGVVIQISFSSIWRGRVEDRASQRAATCWAFFENEQRPFNPKRNTVSLSEQLLGFAEEPGANPEVGPEANRKGGMALASRLVFADALLPEGVEGSFDPKVKLRILDSPKLPCPSMYFKAKGGQGDYIPKRALDPEQHTGQGRKWYLHSKIAPGDAPWVTGNARNPKQKSFVEPMSAGQSLYFHIDFDNLSNIELGLLIYAIEPGTGFHHKIGMGKPLGLGTVKLEIVGYFPIDRIKRYSLEGLRAERYAGAEWTAAGQSLLASKQLPARYVREAAAAPKVFDTLGAARGELSASKLVSADIHQSLMLLGDYAGAPAASAVHYPTIAGQNDKEADHYEWFVYNDGKQERGRGRSPSRQFLKPLAKSKELPDLEEMA